MSECNSIYQYRCQSCEQVFIEPFENTNCPLCGSVKFKNEMANDKYWHPDPKMSVIFELKDKVALLEAENERLKAAVNKVRRTIKKHLGDKTAYKMTACHIIDEMNEWLANNPEEPK